MDYTVPYMKRLTNKHIVLGVTGSIAAYKSADLVRKLKTAGAEVHVIMTKGATEFITPLTMQAVSGNEVHQSLLDEKAEAGMGHIQLARWADLVLIAPASADCLSRLVLGRGDDLLGAVCLASTSPLAVAPAMNQAMWKDPATQENVAKLKTRGIHILGPAEGEQACGDTGPGRMLEPDDLVTEVEGLFESGILSGVKVMVTAGPTQEDIDPVRFISNRSSGKMGYALAQAAVEAGAEVILVSGPTSLPIPDRTRRIDIRSAREMHDAVHAEIKDIDIFIGAAAVADYRPIEAEAGKIKKDSDTLTLQMTKTEDILASVAGLKDRPYMVGFAAETDNLEANALKKLNAKQLDMIAANRVGEDPTGGTLGFESDENALSVFWQDGNKELSRMPKSQLARILVELIARRYKSEHNIIRPESFG
ncbi:MAG: bifunctional phosphopantothenoylcysteine decarboxylase/phosphopantothenate--cysteine ligase CoaBC [Gammaproteobacteria bacterium]|nr:bifunctional phosphopantothenoylcysteine decarboxylase/phosphopantothenate--cysteine ligase CoaBC [Gammaproteobacteria bacterium]